MNTNHHRLGFLISYMTFNMIMLQNTKKYNNIMEGYTLGSENAEVHHCVAGHFGLKRNRVREDNAAYISHFFSTLMYSLEYMII